MGRNFPLVIASIFLCSYGAGNYGNTNSMGISTRTNHYIAVSSHQKHFSPSSLPSLINSSAFGGVPKASSGDVAQNLH